MDLTTKPISRLAFASRYHLDKNTTIFQAIKNYKPDVFLWTGDAVYHKDGHNLSTLENTYRKQFKRKDYKEFRESKPRPYIDGTWDDHDYTPNYLRICGLRNLATFGILLIVWICSVNHGILKLNEV